MKLTFEKKTFLLFRQQLHAPCLPRILPSDDVNGINE